MHSSKKEFLLLFGWDDFFASQIPDLPLLSHGPQRSTDLMFPARVISEERSLYRLQSDVHQTFFACVSGKLQFSASSRIDYPAVGDWVMVECASSSDRGVIHQVLNRKAILHRKQVGSSSDQQILATNVDYVFITSAVNSDLNHRRIERYLAIARDAGTEPIILLSKGDTCRENLFDVVAVVQNQFPTVQVFAIFHHDFASADFLQTFLRNGTTSVFVGSSGVGKSTLVNFLIGYPLIKTQEVRETDGKGRHTTSSRNLYCSRYGGLIIDTPGMRELQLSDHIEGLQSQFSHIEALVQQCRFSNCQHQTEPDCAIQGALSDTSLSKARWESHRKLEAEVRHEMRKKNSALAAEARKSWKKKQLDFRSKNRLKRGDTP